MSKLSRQSSAGFTVIETLIVLGIAGLIFLIIFNAIPALMRNSRNNQRKQDVAAVLAAVSRYQLSHSGTFPNSPIPGDDYLQYTKLSYYDNSAVIVTPQAAGGSEVTNVNDEELEVYNYHLCNTSGAGATSSGAGYRDIVALYKIETGDGTSLQCQQL